MKRVERFRKRLLFFWRYLIAKFKSRVFEFREYPREKEKVRATFLACS